MRELRCSILVGGRDCRNPVHWIGRCGRDAFEFHFCTQHKNKQKRRYGGAYRFERVTQGKKSDGAT